MEILESMTPEDRADIFARFCKGCGVKDDDIDRKRCQCWNDE